jgi:peptide chain release factor 2
MTVYQQDIDKILNQAESLIKDIDLEDIENKIITLQSRLSEPDIWNEPKEAARIQKELNRQQKTVTKYQKMAALCEELRIAGELNEEELVTSSFKQAQEYLFELENERYLGGKFDDRDVLLSVHAGAGGVDAEDWAAMLLSMYQAFCKNMSWNCTVIDLSVGEEGGTKSATLRVEGENAYGFLKEEFGVHRLVRLSPFNAGHTRETSFSLVEVMPVGLEDDLKIQLDEKDLKWDYFMAGGHGGQSVNTTYSAVRVTHLPTRLSAVCQNERSQVQNKQMALKYLASKLATIEAQKQQELKDSLRGSWQSAEWGNQIRSYVLHPYKLVKDVRSSWESTDTESILERGEILPIIWSVKRKTEN